MAPTKTCQALVVRNADNKPKLVKDTVELPPLEDHQVRVRNCYAAQNPTDVQSFDANVFGDGAVLGCDFVGTVVDVGRSVNKVADGDVIGGLIWGGEIKGLGAYSEYTVADQDICFKVPEGVSQEQASTVPLASTTAWLALFAPDCLAIDRHKGTTSSVLIWGGSTSVGLYAIQIAAIYKFKVVTVCSPKHFDLVKRLGAQHFFDYREKDVISHVKTAAPDIAYVFDTIGTTTSSAQAAEAVRPAGGSLCTVRVGKVNTERVPSRVKVTDVLVFTAFNKDHYYGPVHFPPKPDDHKLATEWFHEVPRFLAQGILKPSVPNLLPGGLNDVEQGFQMYREGKISGFKIVYACHF